MGERLANLWRSRRVRETKGAYVSTISLVAMNGSVIKFIPTTSVSFPSALLSIQACTVFCS